MGSGTGGNLIAYSDSTTATGYGISIDGQGNGAEGNCVLGNEFLPADPGDLANAILIAGRTDVVAPVIAASWTIDEQTGHFMLNIQYSVSGAAISKLLRFDFYLVNPATGETIWLAPQAPAADPTAVQPYSVDVSQIASQLTSLSGWYVAATATYSFQDGTASMPSGAVTSMFSNIVTSS